MRCFLKILSFFIFVLIINFASSSLNHERDLGDFCLLKNNGQGICKEIVECDYAKNLFKLRRNEEILQDRCKFKDRMPYVCCPTSSDVRIDGQLISDEIKTSKISESKFKKALCENETPEVILGLNIIGGEAAGVGEFKHIAAIGYAANSTDIKYLCSGSLVADDIVITAAHCVNKIGQIPKVVKLGRTSLVYDEHDFSDADDIEIDYFKIHSNYSHISKHNDIAIMKLKRPFNSSNAFIKPVCLSKNDENLPTNFTIAGFGRKDVDNQITSNWLLKATVYEYPLAECQEEISKASLNKNQIIGSHFCAIGYKGADSCQGDSGGPLSYDKSFGPGKLTFLHGIVSTGIGCGSPTPSIYTKVNRYLDWIEKEMDLME